MADKTILLPLPEEKGVYILWMYLPAGCVIRFGKREEFFKRGYYFYTGSAHGSGGLRARLERHASGKKKMHWHIDYLLARVKLKQIICCVAPKAFEHVLAENMLSADGISPASKRFGSTDCKCETHLFYSPVAQSDITSAFSGKPFTTHPLR